MLKLKQFIFAGTLVFIFNNIISAETPTHLVVIEEDCFNGIDDDGDGLVDVQDPDCLCAFVLDTANLISNPSFTYAEQDCAPNFTGCPARSALQDNCVEDWVSVNNSLILTNYYTKCYF